MALRQHSEQKTAKWDEAALLSSTASEGGELGAGGRTGFGGATQLSDSQLEILDMLEERPSLTAAGRAAARAQAAAVGPTRSYGVDVAFASCGCLAIGTGITMLFFFAALGSILLVSGAILCAIAFEHVALSDGATSELDFDLDAAAKAGVQEIKPFL